MKKNALTLSWRKQLSYRNQSIDLLCKSMDWFLYDNGLRHERVKFAGEEKDFNVTIKENHLLALCKVHSKSIRITPIELFMVPLSLTLNII